GPKALRRRLEQMRKDIELLARLEAVRLSQANIKDGTFDRTGAAAQYARAFRDHGIDLTTLKPEGAARRLRESSRPRELLAAVDTWRCGNRLGSAARPCGRWPTPPPTTPGSRRW